MPDAQVSITERGMIRVNDGEGSAVIPPELLRKILCDEYLKSKLRAKLLKLDQLKTPGPAERDGR